MIPGEQRGVYLYKIKAFVNRNKGNVSYFNFPQRNYHFVYIDCHVNNAVDIL